MALLAEAGDDASQETISAIIAARDDARRIIFDKALTLQTAIESIKDRGYDRPLTPAERKAIEEYRDGIGALREADREVALITVRLLSESSEVQRLINVLSAVNEGLKGKLASIKRVVEVLKKVSDVIGIVDNVIKSLTKLTAFFA